VFDRISHIGVVVNDIAEALRIWRDGLGFEQFAAVTRSRRVRSS
jgi:catechol 2,3-dioxygenase-like lactoylglutathione lyase family enzyme